MLERWQNLWKEIETSSEWNSDLVFGKLLIAYSEPHRCYHNLDHIRFCLNEFDQVKDQLENPHAVEIAIWCHDVIYHLRADDNELQSALWFKSELVTAELSPSLVEEVESLILATCHSTPSLNSLDAHFLIDIDLSILGTPANKFEEYGKNIRKEYSWVPLFLYRKKRAQVLESFLQHSSVFKTEHFQKKYEEQAKKNLKNSISYLKT
ncbi:MAG: putative metal-dependent HD superfamily phosphohydrolase [bacterium]|jgi:predicted metal-dependent HD superfamily phosphohydrolase